MLDSALQQWWCARQAAQRRTCMGLVTRSCMISMSSASSWCLRACSDSCSAPAELASSCTPCRRWSQLVMLLFQTQVKPERHAYSPAHSQLDVHRASTCHAYEPHTSAPVPLDAADKYVKAAFVVCALTRLFERRETSSSLRWSGVYMPSPGCLRGATLHRACAGRACRRSHQAA